MGHAVGFWDWAFGHVGCMGGGTPNGRQIAQQEVDAINYCYAFGAFVDATGMITSTEIGSPLATAGSLPDIEAMVG